MSTVNLSPLVREPHGILIFLPLLEDLDCGRHGTGHSNHEQRSGWSKAGGLNRDLVTKV